jgi:hypothetical protein
MEPSGCGDATCAQPPSVGGVAEPRDAVAFEAGWMPRWRQPLAGVDADGDPVCSPYDYCLRQF